MLDVAEAVADACRGERIPALVGSLDDERAVGLLALEGGADPAPVLTAVCAAARQRLADRARLSPGRRPGTR